MSYKKGHLVKMDEQKKLFFNISICDGKVCNDSPEFYNYYQKLSSDKQEIIDKFFRNIDKEDINDPKFNELLLDFCKDKRINFRNTIPIIFEEQTDELGNTYGHEIRRNYIFPIPKDMKSEFQVVNSKEINNTFICYYTNRNDSLKNTIFYARGRNLINFGVRFVDKNGKAYYSSDRVYSRNTYFLYDSMRKNILSNEDCRVERSKVVRYSIGMSLKFIHDNVHRMDVALIDDGYANNLEISDYNESGIAYHNLLAVASYAQSNVFKDPDLVYNNNNKKNNSEFLNLINKIESCLLMIKDINIDLYNELNTKYQSITGNSTYNKNIEKELDDFYKEINETSILPENSEDAIKLLDSYIENIINGMRSNTYNSEIYLYILTRIHDDIIRNTNNYKVSDITLLNDRMNIIYLLFLYVNKNKYFIPENTSYVDCQFYKDIAFSYIGSNVLGIINAIKLFLNNDIFERNEVLSYHAALFYKSEDTTLPKLLDLIRDLKFIELDKVRELIKK